MSGEAHFTGLKLKSKKLKSGNYQVKFYLDSDNGKTKYGYLLAEPRTPVREVVERIYEKLMNSTVDVRHQHLLSLGKVVQEREVMLFG